MKTEELQHHGSLLTYADPEGREGDETTCLGYLVWWGPSVAEEAAYDANMGRIEGLSKEHADAHNEALDNAILEGLDKHCKVGQGANFYWDQHNPENVTTFMGTVVARPIEVTGGKVRKTIKFVRRNGHVFKGVQVKGEIATTCFFKRIE